MLFQILSLAIIFLILSRIGYRFRRKELSVKESLFWSFFWILAAAAILIPDALTRIANVLGIGRGTDLAFYVSFVLIGYVLFRIVIRLDKIERDITKVARHLALREPEIQNPKSKIQNDRRSVIPSERSEPRDHSTGSG